MDREQWQEKMKLRMRTAHSPSACSPFMRSEANATDLACSPRMDREHATLAELIEQISGICTIGAARDCCGCILLFRDECHAKLNHLINALASYMADHFRYEESQMEGMVPHDYVVAHKADHHFIRMRLLSHMDEFKHSGNTAAVLHLLIAEVQNWLKNHIATHDAVLVSYIASEESQ